MEEKISNIKLRITLIDGFNFQPEKFEQEKYQELLEKYDWFKKNMNKRGEESALIEVEKQLCQYLINTRSIDNEPSAEIRFKAYQQMLEV
jgi:hypothetical protein